MINLGIRDVIDLVASGSADPEVRLEKIFEWGHARQLELVKWLLTASAALFIPVIVAFLREELGKEISRWWIAGTLFGSVALAVWGFLLLIRAKRSYRAFLAAQLLLGEVKRIAPFLEKYREETEES